MGRQVERIDVVVRGRCHAGTGEPDAALTCTITGQVKTSLGGETVFSLNRSESSRLRDRETAPQQREALGAWQQRLREEVRKKLALEASTSPLNARQLGRIDKGTYMLEKVVYYSDPEVYVPGVLLLPSLMDPSTHPLLQRYSALRGPRN